MPKTFKQLAKLMGTLAIAIAIMVVVIVSTIIACKIVVYSQDINLVKLEGKVSRLEDRIRRLEYE